MARFTTAGGSGDGTPGATGPQGPAGAAGDSAYDVAVANGFVGTEQEWLASLGGGGSADLGDFVFTAGTATVNENETLKITANDSDEVRAQLVLDPNNAIVKLEAFTNQNSNTFYSSNPDWDSSTWVSDGGNGSVITFVNAPNIINFMSTQFNLLNNVKISVNGGTSGTWNGGSYGSSDITIYIDGVLPPEDTTINDFSFLYNEVSLIEINQDNGEINIQTQSGNDINISAGDDMYITAQEDDLFLRANDDIRFISRYNDPNFSEQQWRMNSEGGLEFPGSGLISNPSSSDSITISSDSGQFLNDSTIPGNQIATLDDIDESIANSNGNLFQSVRWTPNFTATGLTFTGSDTTHPTYNSHYVKQGQLVSFWIAVDCSTVTSFGTGQLNLELPFAPLAGTMNHFSGWVFVDETANPDLAGHIIVNADHLPNTQTLDLHYIKQQGGANSPVMEAMLKQNTPVVLTTNTNIYVNGTYISA